MLQLNAGVQVTRHPYLRTDTNAHGQTVLIYGPDVEVANVGIDVPQANEPRNQISERELVNQVIFLPPGYSIDHRDQFTVFGQRFGVEGYAPPITNMFTGSIFFTEVKLRKVTG